MQHASSIFFKLLLFFINLILLLSCNQEKSKSHIAPILSTREVSGIFTPDELFIELLLRGNKTLSGDSLSNVLYSQYSKMELKDILKKNRSLERVETDSLIWVYTQMTIKTIYSNDTRKDIIDITNPEVTKSANYVCALIEKKHLIHINDTTFQLTTKGKFSIIFNLCNSNSESERFFDQEVVADCSGVAVSKNQILTAGHCLNESNYANYYLVFDYKIDKNTGHVNKIIHSANVYQPISVTKITGNAYNNDYRLITVSPSLPKNRIAQCRTSGKVTLDDSMYVIGTPAGLPFKVADSAQVIFNDPTSFFKINSDTYGGNSGSPVFNSKTNLLEGILVRGQTDFGFIPSSNNCRYSIRCPERGCFGEDVIRVSQFIQKINN
ncbi:MAG: trypsin-like peptidase domain-containing protein [Niastella sp.]|nr:trypsin-like peptidase domain-containing protein [Niastella sp.]